MALTSLAAYKAWASITATTHDSALSEIIAEVTDAVKRSLGRDMEQATYTEYYDAPPATVLQLRQYPVISVESVHVAPDSRGNPASFTSDTELDQYDDWILDVDKSDGTSSGRLRRVGGSLWGYSRTYTSVRALAPTVVADLKAVKVVYVAGYTPIPDSIKLAVHLATARIFFMRKMGTLPQSASLNGASFSLSSSVAGDVIMDPAIWGRLRPFAQIFSASD